MTQKEKNRRILEELRRLYPDARPALAFENPWQLLVAVILSAQCTDVKVNRATPALFAAYPDAAAMAKAQPEDIEPYIRQLGLYRTKARHLAETARAVAEDFSGQVPRSREELMRLPGVGRKTANVVLSCAFGEDAIAVDTHVFRVSNRLGLAAAEDVGETEEQLMLSIPKKDWKEAHHWLIWHGRRVCHARNPQCDICTLAPLCQWNSRVK